MAFRYEPTSPSTSGDIDDIDFHEATLTPLGTATPHSRLDIVSVHSDDSVAPPTIIPVIESDPLPQKNGDVLHLKKMSPTTSDSGISTGSRPSDTSLNSLPSK